MTIDTELWERHSYYCSYARYPCTCGETERITAVLEKRKSAQHRLDSNDSSVSGSEG